ncbi:MAG: hypothetical protein NTY90_00965 [Candidatus Micrarchaeota archaeon]|nr:hypothetical protein [Candidatus Micrarchaeota archaeon]
MDALLLLIAAGVVGAYCGEWLADAIDPWSNNTLFVALLFAIGAYALGFA